MLVSPLHILGHVTSSSPLKALLYDGLHHQYVGGFRSLAFPSGLLLECRQLLSLKTALYKPDQSLFVSLEGTGYPSGQTACADGSLH